MNSTSVVSNQDNILIDRITKKTEISPGSDYWIGISAKNLDVFVGNSSQTYNFPLKIKKAIAKAPSWIQSELLKRFVELNESYADLILSMDKRYVDEIAFSIAHSPLGKVPPVEVLKRNVLSLYENDEFLDFVEIVDLNMDSRNYKSTIRYGVLDNGKEKTITCPPDIYYWYVVHPRIGFEDPDMIYGHFWREYIMNHNDIGYPLLKEKLSGIRYLWDRESYIQLEKRAWSWSISNHPTAVEVISYWVGKTLPVQAYGDRPLQPSVIAHEHNGWCGELFKVAVAALRASLIPATGVNIKGEDHVWQQFYDEGWHQSDNWWEDGGGAINRSDVYAYVWKRNLSAVYSWRGDGIIFDVTDKYLKKDDYRIVRFVVKDRRGNALDGIRIFVFVKGPFDWTWLKHTIWNLFVQNLWDRLPDRITDRCIPSKIYNKLRYVYSRIPDTTEFAKTTIWNYTNLDGDCEFKLGVNRSYMFLVVGSKDVPIIPRLFFLKKGKDDKTFSVRALFSKRVCKWSIHRYSCPNGDQIELSFGTKAYQLQPGIVGNKHPGKKWIKGKIDCFIMDRKNFMKYLNGRRFSCISHLSHGNVSLRFDDDIYVVFRNNAVKSYVVVNFSLDIKSSKKIDRVRIISPSRSLFDKPIFDIRDTINISGIATDNVTLMIDGNVVDVSMKGYRWWYNWYTCNVSYGEHLIEVFCNDEKDEMSILLYDLSPPLLQINDFPKVSNKDAVSDVEVRGWCEDNADIREVIGYIDGKRVNVTLNESIWSLRINLHNLEIGEHFLKAVAIDTSNLTCCKGIRFSVINNSYVEKPEILHLYHLPTQPTESDNIVIYADINSSKFNITKVVLHVESNNTNITKEMFRYGISPVQERHSEDPLANISNAPIYGAELGEFPANTTLTYWIEVFNSANFSSVSGKRTILVD